MLIYVNGCSHTQEYIINKDKTSPYVLKSWAGLVMEGFYQKYNHYLEYRSNIKSGAVLINEGLSGVGNDRIFHTTLESITKLINEAKIPDYVIIQWSGPNRREYCDESGISYYVNLYDHTQYHIKFEPMASQHTIHYMYALQEFLKKYNIKYFFIPYMALDESVKKTSIFNLIDMERVVDFNMGANVFFKGAIDYILKNGLNKDVQGHPNEFGYQEIADRVLKHISKTMIKNIL
jgi:hypothetical protein